MPIQLDFILRRLAAMADQDPELRTRQPWQAAYTKDYGWLGQVITGTTRATTASCRCWPPASCRPLAASPLTTSRPRPTRSCTAARNPTLAAATWPAPTGRWSSCWATWI